MYILRTIWCYAKESQVVVLVMRQVLSLGQCWPDSNHESMTTSVFQVRDCPAILK